MRWTGFRHPQADDSPRHHRKDLLRGLSAETGIE
jgi:hypothetical protein